jgi:hypothetical protein
MKYTRFVKIEGYISNMGMCHVRYIKGDKTWDI